MPPSKGLITIAIGKKYIVQAKSLSRSSMLHAPNTIRAVMTDIPEDLKDYYDIVIPYKQEYGNPFALKLKLPLYAPFDKTLYIDADSLILHPIDMYWDFLLDQPFVYEGKVFLRGFWYFDIEKIIKQIDVPWIPIFNSGMFLFEKNKTSESIFAAAYNYHENNGAFDIPAFRDKMLPDEPFLAMALARHNIKPVEKDYGRFSRTLIGAENIHINAVKGIGFFRKNGELVFPLIVHFCGRFGRFLLLREAVRLFFYFNLSLGNLFIGLCSLFRKIIKKEKRGTAP
jgi:hypothetical protein